MMVHDFACIGKLSPNCSLPATLGIDFNDSLQPAVLEIVSSAGNLTVNNFSLVNLALSFLNEFLHRKTVIYNLVLFFTM